MDKLGILPDHSEELEEIMNDTLCDEVNIEIVDEKPVKKSFSERIENLLK